MFFFDGIKITLTFAAEKSKFHVKYGNHQAETILMYLMPTRIEEEGVELKCEYFSYEEITRHHTWQDGHPCGIEE